MLVNAIYFLTLVYVSYSAKILCVFPMPSLSHSSIFRPIYEELSLKGHQVTVITANPQNQENLVNLTEIEISSLHNIARKSKHFIDKLATNSFLFKRLYYAERYVLNYVEEVLIHIETIFPDPSTNFDLIILEPVHHLLYGLRCRFKAPIIALRPSSMPFLDHDQLGDPTHFALYFDFNYHLKQEISFLNKVKNVVFGTTLTLIYHTLFFFHTNGKSRQYFGDNCSYLSDTVKDVALVETHTDPVLYVIRPVVPRLIEMGGLMHIRPQKERIPLDLQRYLDESSEGVIFFSLGSVIKSRDLPTHIRNIFIETFSELPYKILWKWEDVYLENKPKNVMIRQWIPQQEVLAHQNIKAFISHGGPLSVEEAILNCVPLVGIPIVFDQFDVVRKSVKLGIAKEVEFLTITKAGLKQAIIEVIINNKYKENLKYVKTLFEDRPIQSLEKSIWWIEYVLRHQGAEHLRNSPSGVLWWEYLLFDLTAVIVLCFGTIVCLVFLMLKINKIK